MIHFFIVFHSIVYIKNKIKTQLVFTFIFYLGWNRTLNPAPAKNTRLWLHNTGQDTLLRTTDLYMQILRKPGICTYATTPLHTGGKKSPQMTGRVKESGT